MTLSIISKLGTRNNWAGGVAEDVPVHFSGSRFLKSNISSEGQVTVLLCRSSIPFWLLCFVPFRLFNLFFRGMKFQILRPGHAKRKPGLQYSKFHGSTEIFVPRKNVDARMCV
jgi:hypothetical protein